MQTRLQKSLQTCGICYDKVTTQGKVESCPHVFCFNCIHHWADRQNTCPLCKRRFNTIQKVQKRVTYHQKYHIKDKVVQVRPKDQQQAVSNWLGISLHERIFRISNEQDLALFGLLFDLDFFTESES